MAGHVLALLAELAGGYPWLMSLPLGHPSGIRYILIHEEERVGTFLALRDAFDEGIRRYGTPPFTVIEEPADGGRGDLPETSRIPFILEYHPRKNTLQPPKRWWDPKTWRGPYLPPPSAGLGRARGHRSRGEQRTWS